MSIIGSIIQSAGGGGGAATSFEAGSEAEGRVEFLEKNLALNTIRDVVSEGWSVTNMVDGIADEYNDETGVDTVTSTAIYDAINDRYVPSGTTGDLLIQSDTTDGSTTFIDSSANEATITANGDAQHDTDQFKFGASSILFDGTGDYLSVPNSANWDFGSGDFTVDCWVRCANTTGYHMFVSQLGASGNYAWSLFSNGTAVGFAHSTNGSDFITTNSASSVFTANTWHHVAVVRDGNTLTVYFNGASVATRVMTGVTINTSTAALEVGAQNGSTNLWAGHIDEIRVVKGTAVWTTAFTPPTASYGGNDNLILQSQTFTAQTVPSNARLVFIHEPTVAVTLNTDIKAFISRDGGTTFTECTLTNEADYDASSDVICSDDLDISGQPSGTSMVYKIQTYNTKSQRIHASWLQWR